MREQLIIKLTGSDPLLPPPCCLRSFSASATLDQNLLPDIFFEVLPIYLVY